MVIVGKFFPIERAIFDDRPMSGPILLGGENSFVAQEFFQISKSESESPGSTKGL